MNILFITHCDPRTMDFGSAQRSHLIWEALKKIGTVYTVYNVGPLEQLTKDEGNRIASWALAPQSLILRYLQVYFCKAASPAAWPFRRKSAIRAKLPWKDVSFDAVVVRYLTTASYANAWQFGSLYVDVDDLPIEAYDTICGIAHIPCVRFFWHCVVKVWQRMILRKCCATWIANPHQVDIVQKIVSCAALPNLALQPKSGYQVNGIQREQLMTVGLLSYEPNFQGVDWFVTTIWPKVHESFPTMSYVIAGRDCPDEYSKKWQSYPGVKVLGFVDDLDALYEESLAVVTPILSGSGTCIKVIEAALHGRRIFATDFALRGFIDIDRDKLGIVPIKCPDDLIHSIRTDLDSLHKLQLSIEKNARNINSFDQFFKTISSTLSSQDNRVEN